MLLQLGQLPLRLRLLEPFEQLVGERQRLVRNTAKVVREGAVEAVEVLLAVDAESARHFVEPVQVSTMELERQRLGEREGLLRADPHAAIA